MPELWDSWSHLLRGDVDHDHRGGTLAAKSLERGGWTIEFSPDDRLAAEALAERVEYLKKRYVEATGMSIALGPEEFEKRRAELAAKLAQLCGFPERTREIEEEFARLSPALQELRSSIHAAFFPRAVAIWRPDEVRQRLAAGESIPGFVWDEAGGGAKLELLFNWEISKDYGVSKTISAPAAIVLRQEEPVKSASVTELLKNFDQWMEMGIETAAAAPGQALRTGVAIGLRKMVGADWENHAADRWIREGLIGWAWRETVVQAVPWKRAPRYAVVIPQLLVPVGTDRDARLRLEEWPEKDDGERGLYAIQVFCSIAERHGADAVPRLLTEFWKLAPPERTTQSLKQIYRERMSESLEMRAPWRSLGPAKDRIPGR